MTKWRISTRGGTNYAVRIPNCLLKFINPGLTITTISKNNYVVFTDIEINEYDIEAARYGDFEGFDYAKNATQQIVDHIDPSNYEAAIMCLINSNKEFKENCEMDDEYFTNDQFTPEKVDVKTVIESWCLLFSRFVRESTITESRNTFQTIYNKLMKNII